eukprot:923254-Alexandrium_andersonii.AAC.1
MCGSTQRNRVGGSEARRRLETGERATCPVDTWLSVATREGVAMRLMAGRNGMTGGMTLTHISCARLRPGALANAANAGTA